jgi:hypothetical protein
LCGGRIDPELTRDRLDGSCLLQHVIDVHNRLSCSIGDMPCLIDGLARSEARQGAES